MVLQAVWDDIQVLLSLPLTPFTYHVVLARTVGADAKESARRRLLNTSSCFMILYSFFANVLGHIDAGTADPPLALLARPVGFLLRNELECSQVLLIMTVSSNSPGGHPRMSRASPDLPRAGGTRKDCTHARPFVSRVRPKDTGPKQRKHNAYLAPISSSRPASGE